jgi:hypothetical protein
MKIYRLPVDPQFQPDRQNFMSPPHSSQWGAEQDFEDWLRRSEYITDDPRQADWEYLPVFWNRYYINNQWGQGGLIELQAEILSLVSRNRPTFTIAEYDLASMQPFWDLCSMTVFTASRRGEGTGIDIPLLCSPHDADAPHPSRRWLASFAGNLNTFSPRPEMAEALAGREDCRVEHADKGERYFVDLMLDSYLALCPRGHGGQSFRFYEAMQLGVAPLLIGDLDTRPFKKWLDWDKVSLYRPGAEGLSRYLDGLDRDGLVTMGKRAQEMYAGHLAYGQWCRYVIKDLAHA